MFVHCGKMQDCELKLNGESFEGELHFLGGDWGKTRSRYSIFKETQERNLKVCEESTHSGPVI